MKITTRVSPEENYYVGQSSGPFLNFPVERAVNPIYNSSQILISLKLTGGHFRRVKPMQCIVCTLEEAFLKPLQNGLKNKHFLVNQMGSRLYG